MPIRLLYILLLASASLPCLGQYFPLTLPEHFLGRQPSARAEAMGRGYAAVDGDLAGIYFNPAGIAGLRAAEVNVAYTPGGHYTLSGGYYRFLAAGARVNKRFVAALSQYQFHFGSTPVANAYTPPYSRQHTLTLAAHVFKNWQLGVNMNYFAWQTGNKESGKPKTFFVDAGVLKKIPLAAGSSNSHLLHIGASLTNITRATLRRRLLPADIVNELPSIARVAAAYHARFGSRYLLDTVSLVSMVLQAEWQPIINSRYWTVYKTGAELTVLNLLSLRAGWYTETKIPDYGFPDANNTKVSAFTYGFGVQVPVYRLTRLPVQLHFDFASLPQVSYSRIFTSWPNFNTYTLRLGYTGRRLFAKNR